MPRKTLTEELQSQENSVSSPIRRSSRIAQHTPTPAAAVTKRRSSANAETPSKLTKVKRLSLSQESSLTESTEQRITLGKITTDAPATPKRTARTTRSASKSPSALAKEKEVEVSKPRTRRGSTSKQLEEADSERVASPAPLHGTRHKSLHNENNSPSSKDTGPAKAKTRRSSITEKVVPLEAIQESPKTEPNKRSLRSQKQESASLEPIDENEEVNKTQMKEIGDGKLGESEGINKEITSVSPKKDADTGEFRATEHVSEKLNDVTEIEIKNDFKSQKTMSPVTNKKQIEQEDESQEVSNEISNKEGSIGQSPSLKLQKIQGSLNQSEGNISISQEKNASDVKQKQNTQVSTTDRETSKEGEIYIQSKTMNVNEQSSSLEKPKPNIENSSLDEKESRKQLPFVKLTKMRSWLRLSETKADTENVLINEEMHVAEIDTANNQTPKEEQTDKHSVTTDLNKKSSNLEQSSQCGENMFVDKQTDSVNFKQEQKSEESLTNTPNKKSNEKKEVVPSPVVIKEMSHTVEEANETNESTIKANRSSVKEESLQQTHNLEEDTANQANEMVSKAVVEKIKSKSPVVILHNIEIKSPNSKTSKCLFQANTEKPKPNDVFKKSDNETLETKNNQQENDLHKNVEQSDIENNTALNEENKCVGILDKTCKSKRLSLKKCSSINDGGEDDTTNQSTHKSSVLTNKENSVNNKTDGKSLSSLLTNELEMTIGSDGSFHLNISLPSTQGSQESINENSKYVDSPCKKKENVANTSGSGNSDKENEQTPPQKNQNVSTLFLSKPSPLAEKNLQLSVNDNSNEQIPKLDIKQIDVSKKLLKSEADETTINDTLNNSASISFYEQMEVDCVDTDTEEKGNKTKEDNSFSNTDSVSEANQTNTNSTESHNTSNLNKIDSTVFLNVQTNSLVERDIDHVKNIGQNESVSDKNQENSSSNKLNITATESILDCENSSVKHLDTNDVKEDSQANVNIKVDRIKSPSPIFSLHEDQDSNDVENSAELKENNEEQIEIEVLHVKEANKNVQNVVEIIENNLYGEINEEIASVNLENSDLGEKIQSSNLKNSPGNDNLKTNDDKKTKANLSIKLDALIASVDHNPSESDEEQHYNDFIYDMAEEGEEDTPSEDSNAIICEGESINSSDTCSESDESYENDSFINDDDDEASLLSGEENFLKDNIDKKKRSRIIKVSDSEEEIENIHVVSDTDQVPKNETGNIKDVKTHDLTNECIEHRSDLKVPIEAAQVIREDSSSDNSAPHIINDNSNVTLSKPEMQTKESYNLTEQAADEIINLDTDNDSILSSSIIDRNSAKKRRKSTRKSSITIQENIKLEDIKHGELSKRITKVVDWFYSGIKEKNDSSCNVSLNVSLDCDYNSPVECNESLQRSSVRKVEENLEGDIEKSRKNRLSHELEAEPKGSPKKMKYEDNTTLNTSLKKQKKPNQSLDDNVADNKVETNMESNIELPKKKRKSTLNDILESKGEVLNNSRTISEFEDESIGKLELNPSPNVVKKGRNKNKNASFVKSVVDSDAHSSNQENKELDAENSYSYGQKKNVIATESDNESNREDSVKISKKKRKFDMDKPLETKHKRMKNLRTSLEFQDTEIVSPTVSENDIVLTVEEKFITSNDELGKSEIQTSVKMNKKLKRKRSGSLNDLKTNSVLQGTSQYQRNIGSDGEIENTQVKKLKVTPKSGNEFNSGNTKEKKKVKPGKTILAESCHYEVKTVDINDTQENAILLDSVPLLKNRKKQKHKTVTASGSKCFDDKNRQSQFVVSKAVKPSIQQKCSYFPNSMLEEVISKETVSTQEYPKDEIKRKSKRNKKLFIKPSLIPSAVTDTWNVTVLNTKETPSTKSKSNILRSDAGSSKPLNKQKRSLKFFKTKTADR